MTPLPANYYDFFGLPHTLDLDLKDLEQRFYALSRQYHPDLYTLKNRDEQQYALDATAILNDGYRTLRDPLARAEYLLKENGFEIGEQGSKNVPPELLEEVFELNMALEESDEAAVSEARKRFEGMLREVDSELEKLEVEYDQSLSRDTLAKVRAALNRRKYIQNLVLRTEAVGHE